MRWALPGFPLVGCAEPPLCPLVLDTSRDVGLAAVRRRSWQRGLTRPRCVTAGAINTGILAGLCSCVAGAASDLLPPSTAQGCGLLLGLQITESRDVRG